MTTDFELWLFLAGLGIFLFGMHMMEESIRLLSGGAFRSLIRKYTSTRINAIFTGTISTAILQSSSAVSLMVLAFVGAGIMPLTQAIAVMMGAKIGTTATAWIVAVFGFKFSIDAFSLPLIGIGGLGMIFLAKSTRYVNISKFLVAFGFLFMGLDYMKGSVDQFSDGIEPAQFEGYGILLFMLLGLAMTAIMQSSSATIAIVLTMLYSGVIQFESGAAMVIGANVGTTVTVLLGSIGDMASKKQAALSQLIFATSTAVITLILLTPLTWLVLNLFSFESNLVLGLALFHTIFNVFGVVIFYPFIKKLAAVAEKVIPEKHNELSKFIHKTDPTVTEAGMEAFRKEIRRQLHFSQLFIDQLLFPGKKEKSISYNDLELYHAEIFEYYTQMISVQIDAQESEKLDRLLRASRNIMNATRNMYELRDELSILKREIDPMLQRAYDLISKRLKAVYETGSNLYEKTDSKEQIAVSVDELLQGIERGDKEFIQMCSNIISSGKIKKVEVTFLLMLNRVVTQSGRMFIYAMKTLLAKREILERKNE